MFHNSVSVPYVAHPHDPRPHSLIPISELIPPPHPSTAPLSVEQYCSLLLHAQIGALFTLSVTGTSLEMIDAKNQLDRLISDLITDAEGNLPSLASDAIASANLTKSLARSLSL